MSSRFISSLASTVLFGLLAGCATAPSPPSSPLSVVSAAAQFSARSLHDDNLRRFLQENLNRVPDTDWDFESLSWVAFHYHPSLGVARAQWTIARAAQMTAAQRANPTISLTPGYNTTRIPGTSPWFPAINFDFLFPTNGKRQRQQDIARSDAEAARLGMVIAVWQVRSELRRSLTEAEFAGRRAVLLQEQANVQRELVNVLTERFKEGSIAAADISLTRTAQLRAEAAAADAQSVASTSRARVAAALGLSVTALDGVKLPVAPVAAVLTAQDLAVASRESLQTRSDVLAALAKYESAQAALELEVAKQIPDLHIGPGYQWDQGANKWSVAFTFELPVFHRNEAPIAEAAARRGEAAAQFISVQSQAIAATEVAAAAQAAAAHQAQRARQLFSETKKQNQLVGQRVELGAADNLELQTARLDVANAQTAVLDADYAAALSSGLLEDALQIPFPHFAALSHQARVNASSMP